MSLMPKHTTATKRTVAKPAASAPKGLTLLYACASRNQDNGASRAELKRLSRADRERHAPPAVRGKALEIFLSTGKTFSEQREEGEAARLATITIETNTTKENTMKRNSKTAKSADAKPEPATQPKPAPTSLTAAQIARDAELDGKEFRKFLRSKDVRKGGITSKAQATKLVKAFRKELAAAAA